MTKQDKQAEDLQAVLDAIARMEDHDRAIAERLHALITKRAPSLIPRTWYGMPAYARESGKVLCYFRDRKKFGERYITFGFNDTATLDHGTMWPIMYAITDLSDDDEATIVTLITQATA